MSGRGGGGQVVSVLAFFSDDPSLNPAEVSNLYCVTNQLKRKTINEEAGNGLLKVLMCSGHKKNTKVNSI